MTRLLSLAIALALAGVCTHASAAPIDGVKCPNGYETLFDEAKKNMRCEKQQALLRPTVCSPAHPEHIVYRAAKGADYCLTTQDAAGSRNDIESRRRPVACSNESGEGLRWQVEVDGAGERDRCKAIRSEWIYPSQQ